MRQVKSSFVNPAGLSVLAALALLSAYLGIDLLFALLAGAFLLCLVSWLWTRSALGKLSIETGRSDVCGFPGDELDVRIKISNNKLIPVVWLRAELPSGEGKCVSSAEEDAAVFSWVMPRQSLEWTERLNAVKRGVSVFGSVEASSGDGFGLSEKSVSLPLERKMRAVVFPALMDVDVSSVISRLSEMELSKKGMYTDATLVRNVRDYSGGESFRDINWRLLAKGGDLLVNVKEKMDVRRVCILPDLESYSKEEIISSASGNVSSYCLMEPETERMLSIAASVVTELCARGVICSLVIPGYTVRDEETGESMARKARIVLPEEGDAQAETLLTALAEIDYKGGPTVLPPEIVSDGYHLLGQMFCIAASKSLRLDAADAAMPSPVWYILPEDDGSGRIIEETELLR